MKVQFMEDHRTRLISKCSELKLNCKKVECLKNLRIDNIVQAHWPSTGGFYPARIVALGNLLVN